MRYKQGSLRLKRRKSGAKVWEFRYTDQSGVMRQRTLDTSKYPTESSARVALQDVIFALNKPQEMTSKTPFGLIIERFIAEERLVDIASQPPGPTTIKGMAYSTAKSYLSTIGSQIKPRWGNVAIEDIKAVDVLKWMRDDCDHLAGLTKARVKSLMSMFFDRAMLWEILELQRNPMELVRLKGVSIRKKKKVVLTVEQFQELRDMLPEPYKAMVTLAVCTGMRVSEVTALRWEHIEKGSLLVQASSYNRRIGRVKTEASSDYIPLHPDILRDIPWGSGEGFVFPSSAPGGVHRGGSMQEDILIPAGRKLGIASLGWHTFRHTYRSLLDGEPVGVQQKLMRHANVSTTMNVYGESSMRAKRDANSKVVEMVIGRSA